MTSASSHRTDRGRVRARCAATAANHCSRATAAWHRNNSNANLGGSSHVCAYMYVYVRVCVYECVCVRVHKNYKGKNHKTARMRTPSHNRRVHRRPRGISALAIAKIGDTVDVSLVSLNRSVWKRKIIFPINIRRIIPFRKIACFQSLKSEIISFSFNIL